MKRFFLAALPALLIAGSAAAESPYRPLPPENEERAYFAMGCFWCGEADFEKVSGVTEAVSGYAGGHVKNPTYEQVTGGNTGHYESVRVSYDPEKVSYKQLLDVFWHNVDPFDAKGQFCDKGASYRPAIFPTNAEERAEAEASKAAVEKRFGKPVAVEIVDTKSFYPAEGYHQDYYKKNALKYKFYRTGCGRDARLKEIWGN